nr:hypothetical protein [uncultured Draconibacterium sp.]
MWGDSWINLMMKMKDLPHYSYKKKDKDSEPGVFTADDLKKRFPNQQIS